MGTVVIQLVDQPRHFLVLFSIAVITSNLSEKGLYITSNAEDCEGDLRQWHATRVEGLEHPPRELH